ncbi:MAG: AsmA family protein [Pseudomonadota bacterium]
MRRRALAAAGLLILVVLAGTLWLATFDPNQHKATIERWAGDALGRSVKINGPVTLTRGLTSTLVVNDLVVAGSADADPAVSIQRAEVSVVLASLLFGPLHLPEVAVSSAELSLPFEEGNRAFDPGDGQVPRIDQLTLKDITVHFCRSDGSTVDLSIAQAAVAPATDGTTTTLDMTGTLAALPLKVSGTTGTVASLFAGGQPVATQIEATLADARLGLSGHLSLAGGEMAYQLDAELDLPAGSKLADAFGLPSVALAASTTLRAQDNAITADPLSATWGKSDLAGDLSWQFGERCALRGTFAAKRIDLLELGPSIGMHARSAMPKSDGDLVPDLALPTPANLPIDLDLALNIEQLDLRGGTIKDLAAKAKGDERKLDLDLSRASIGGGTLQGRIEVGAGQPPDVALTLEASKVDLASVIPEPKDGSQMPQDVNVKIDLAGHGANLRAAAASASGSILIDTGAAVIKSEAADLIGRSIFTSILPGVNSTGRYHIMCSVLDLEAKDGKARTTALVIDGKHTVLGGGGAINLATGAIDFVVVPKAKDATLAPLVTPIHLDGTITDPKLVGDAKTILSSAGHLLLGIVNPLSLATPVLHPDRKGGLPCADPSILQQSSPADQVGATAVDAVEGTAKGVGTAIDEIGKDAKKLLKGVTER